MELPDVLVEWPGGEIMVKGHRIGLHHVIRRYRDGWTTMQMVEDFDTLSPYQVEKVIAFYLQNTAAVDAYIAEYDAESDRLMAEAPHSSALERIRELTRRREAAYIP